jgi:hypothetical protein
MGIRPERALGDLGKAVTHAEDRVLRLRRSTDAGAGRERKRSA